jgi:hypothetical protein
MRILLASIPATGHFQSRHLSQPASSRKQTTTAICTSVVFHDKIEKAAVRFFPLPRDPIRVGATFSYPFSKSTR